MITGFEVKCEYTRLVPIGELRPHPENCKNHSDEAVERQVKVMEYQGWRRPITVSNRSNVMTAGHKRLLAAKKVGATHVPVSFQDYVDEDQEIADLVADNALNEWEPTDLKKVNELMSKFDPGFDIDHLGIKDFVLDMSDKEFGSGEDEVPEAPPEPVVKRGELWVLGEHRLLIDDCTVKENVERLMAGEKADMVFTDPPYGMRLDADYSGMVNKNGVAGAKHKQIVGDDSDFDPAPMFDAFGYCEEIVMFGADYFAHLIPNRNDGAWLVWDKRVEAKYDAIIGSGFELLWSKKKRKRELLRCDYSSWGARMTDNLDGHKPHPTMKPIKLLEMVLERVPGETVVDLFLGSGSTLIACEKTNRRCFGCEIDEHYSEVIIQRWMKYTGKMAYREDGKSYEEIKKEVS